MRINTYTCLDCGGEFEEPVEHIEHHGLDTPPYEAYPSCPGCGSGAFAHTHTCDWCGAVITGQYIRTKSGDELCEECFEVHELGD